MIEHFEELNHLQRIVEDIHEHRSQKSDPVKPKIDQNSDKNNSKDSSPDVIFMEFKPNRKSQHVTAKKEIIHHSKSFSKSKTLVKNCTHHDNRARCHTRTMSHTKSHHGPNRHSTSIKLDNKRNDSPVKKSTAMSSRNSSRPKTCHTAEKARHTSKTSKVHAESSTKLPTSTDPVQSPLAPALLNPLSRSCPDVSYL